MDKSVLIEKTMVNIQKLPLNKVQEVNEFVEFLLSKINDRIMTEGIQELINKSHSFDFLKDEPDLYSTDDLKIKYK